MTDAGRAPSGLRRRAGSRAATTGAALAVAAAAVLAAACGDSTRVESIEVGAVVVTPAESEIPLGGEGALSARVLDAGGADVTAEVEVAWSSGPPGIVVVDDRGHVTAVTEGLATVRATAGGVSGTASVEVYDPTPPDAPGDVTATVVSDTEVALTWSDASDNEDEYRVEREASSGAPSAAGADAGSAAGSAAGSGPAGAFGEVVTLPANTTAWIDTGLEPGTSWRYRVRACNRNGCVPDGGGDDATSGVVTTEQTLVVVTGSLVDGFAEAAYEQALEAAGGRGDYVWSVAEGEPPPGLELSPGGILAGTPTTPGEYLFTAAVASGAQAASAELSVTVHEAPIAPVVVTTTLPRGDRGQPYSVQLEAMYGDGTYTWDAPGGGLPNGIALAGSGLLSGTPGSVGTWDFTVRARSFGLTGSAELTLEVVAPLAITTASLPVADVHTYYDRVFAVDGGNGTYAWSLAGGSLPPGMSFDASRGRVFGTPEASGTWAFTVAVQSGDQTVQRALELEVRAAPVVLRTYLLGGARAGEPWARQLVATGGDGESYAWSVTAGALPPGISLDAATGALTGTPSGPGVHYFAVEVASAGRVAARTYAMAVSGAAVGAFNMDVLNVSQSGAIPSQPVIDAISAAVARWEEVVVGDLPDRTYGPSEWTEAYCEGDAPKLNGTSVDDMVVFLDLAEIDGSGGILGSAGPCSVRGSVWPSVSTIFGRLRLDAADLVTLDAGQRFALAFHEIGHIVGLGTLWSVPTGATGTPLMSDRGGPDPRYEGADGNAEFTGTLGGGSAGAAKIPIEADGPSGTRDSHWDEGEFDSEIMTGWAEGAGTSQPISSMTIAAVGDLGYTVSLSAADPYAIDACAPACSALRAPESGLLLAHDVWDGPLAVELPGGGVMEVRPASRYILRPPGA